MTPQSTSPPNQTCELDDTVPAQSNMDTLIETLLSSSSLESRTQAAAQLAELDELPREAVEALRTCLRAAEAGLVEAAVLALSRHDFLSELHELLDEVHGPKPGLARRMLRRTLDREVDDIRELVQLLGGDKLEALLASELLAEQGETVVPIIAELIERHVDSKDGDDDWWRAQSWMYWAGRVLRRLGPRAAAAASTLSKIFTHGDPYRDTTHQATQALAAMGAGVIPILLSTLSGELALRLIAGMDEAERIRAADVLLPVLIERLPGSDDYELRLILRMLEPLPTQSTRGHEASLARALATVEVPEGEYTAELLQALHSRFSAESTSAT
jgi:hypothetical protein